MSKKTEKESSSVYAVPSQQDDLVTTMCRIVDEDPPQPMRGMKKANRVPNAAEQFSAEHHGEHEARARQSCDKIGRVHRHNQACPKMYDELEKKASASRVVAVTMSRRDALQLTSSNKNNRRNKTSSRHVRNRRSRPQKPRTIRNRLSRRKKPNRRLITGNRSYRLSKIWKSKGCQCHPTGRSEFENSNENGNTNDVIIWTKNSLNHPRGTSQHSRSYVTEKFPGTSEPSISTYHSFSSMEQEPMVS